MFNTASILQNLSENINKYAHNLSEKKAFMLFISSKIVAFYCSRIDNSCKCYNSCIFWAYILYCFKQRNIFVYDFRSTSKRQHKRVPLSERQQKALYVFSLAGRLGSINKTKLIFYSFFDKTAKEIFISFAIIKGYHLSAIREKLSDLKANTNPIESSLTTILIHSWNTFRHLLAKKLVAEKGVSSLPLGWCKWP